ncbi:MAG: hypothetical protein ACJ76I_06250 [Gaiellaceae bacterium]
MAARTEAQILADIAARRAAGIADVGDELRQRIEDLGSLVLDTVDRQQAFAEVFDALRPPNFDLFPEPDACAIAQAGHVIRVTGVIVDTANRLVVGHLVRTISLDDGIAEHDLLALQQPYRDHALTPVLIWQSFNFYDQLGLFAVLVHAALHTGRWYWARLGFEFALPRFRTSVGRWGRAVNAALGSPVDVSQFSEARQWALLGSTPPHAGTAADVVETTFEEIAHALPRARWAHFGGQSFGSYLGIVADANRLRFDQPIPLGRAIMLSGPDWLGFFPLQDSARRQQLELYMLSRLRRLVTSTPSGP